MLVPALAQQAGFGNPRVKPAVLEAIAAVAERGFESKSASMNIVSVLTRHALPLALSGLTEAKSEVRVANNTLLRSLHRVLAMGGTSAAGLLDATHTSKLSTAQVAKLQEVLSSSS